MKNKKLIQFDFNDRAEIDHRFQGNIIGLVDDKTGEVLPFRLHRARRESFEGELYNPKANRYATDTYDKKHTDFSWGFPELGYVNVDNIATFLSRKAGRYYTRGYDSRYVDSKTQFLNELRSLGVNKTYSDSGSGKLMYALFNQEFEDFHTVLNSIEDNSYLSRAFQKNWCIGIKSFSNCPVLYYKNNMVGYVSDGKAKLVPQSEFLKEDLSAHTDVEVVKDFEEVYVNG